MGSFAKRARALLVFTTGVVPMAAAQAQDTPVCEFKIPISKFTSAEGDLFTKDEDPTIYGWFTVKAEANKVKPANKELLVTPTAMIAPSYYWQADGTLTSYALEVRNPYVVEAGSGDGPTFETTLDVDGSQQTFSMQTFSFNNWDELDNFSVGDSFGTLKKDVALTLGPPDGDPDGTSYTFTFPKAEIVKAYKTAQPQFTGLLAKAHAGTCLPNHQVTASGSGTSGSAGTYGCFLTTATCEAVGLDDDCWELRTLRRFRDGWLAEQSGGMDDIKAYYAKAPAIVERLRGDRQALLRLYWTRIVPSALAAQIGANRVARAIYSKGMRELAAG